jgi:hypothetical protein
VLHPCAARGVLRAATASPMLARKVIELVFPALICLLPRPTRSAGPRVRSWPPHNRAGDRCGRLAAAVPHPGTAAAFLRNHSGTKRPSRRPERGGPPPQPTRCHRPSRHGASSAEITRRHDGAAVPRTTRSAEPVPAKPHGISRGAWSTRHAEGMTAARDVFVFTASTRGQPRTTRRDGLPAIGNRQQQTRIAPEIIGALPRS